jgi:hypothetical protein
VAVRPGEGWLARRFGTDWSAISPKLAMPKAVGEVVIHHADRLHESVTNSWADEFEASREQLLAHAV